MIKEMVGGAALVAVVLSAGPAFAKRHPVASPKLARASQFANNLDCQLRRVAKDAQTSGIYVLNTKAKLSLNRTRTIADTTSVGAKVSFAVFEIGPAVTFGDTVTDQKGVEFNSDFKTDDPLPARCNQPMVSTYALNGKLLGKAVLTPLPSLASIYHPTIGNQMIPDTFVMSKEFSTEVKTGSTLKINLLFITVEKGGSKGADQSGTKASAKYEATFKIDTAKTMAALTHSH